MMTITTKFVHNDNNGAKIVAKGAGKQRTTQYDHAVSHERNHGAAAGTLALVLGLSDSPEIQHIENAGQHKFTFPV